MPSLAATASANVLFDVPEKTFMLFWMGSIYFVPLSIECRALPKHCENLKRAM